MKIRTVAHNSFGSFLHSKVHYAMGLLFLVFFLFGLFNVYSFKHMTTASNALQMQQHMMHDISNSIVLLYGLGNLLAAWAAADSIASEIKSGTILAVMARPLHRWQFLAGKYLAVLMLMSIYAMTVFGITYLLLSLGGQPFYISGWALVIYPLVRYAIWAAIAMFLGTFLNPIIVISIVAFLLSVIAFMSTPMAVNRIPAWIQMPLHIALPMTTVVLDESRFFNMTQAALHRYPWTDHLTALTYGIDYALVFFLLAIALFQRRSIACG